MELAKIRLQVVTDDEPRQVRFYAVFSANDCQPENLCAPAQLLPGDGRVLDLGTLCAPTAVNWREQRQVELGSYEYEGSGPFTAQVRWGGAAARATVSFARGGGQAPGPALPEVILFSPRAIKDQLQAWSVWVRLRGMQREHRVRLDAGAGQCYWLNGEDGSTQSAEWTVTFAKPGTYRLGLDLLDADGFWLATLGQSQLEVKAPSEAELLELVPAEVAEPPLRSTIPDAARYVDEPWLPYSYGRPRQGGARTYAGPGGGKIKRTLWGGTYVSVRSQTMVGGALWYRTSLDDWLPADSLTMFRPSALRGVVLGGSTLPPSPPTPPPTPNPPPGTRRGVVTATHLNVRARPGVSTGNPPIDQLAAGAEVSIFEEAVHAGATWYRIGPGRWVHSEYVRISESRALHGLGLPALEGLRRGVVASAALYVRGRPGVRADNPPVDQLGAGTEVVIHEEAAEGDSLWYRVGDERWVHGAFVRVSNGGESHSNRAVQAAAVSDVQAPSGSVRLPVGWVVPANLNVYARPGVAADNRPIQQLTHNQLVPVLEEKVAGGARWHRIGAGQWVDGRYIGVARPKNRPSRIGADELWVAVSLSEQTLVAYAGDQPVFAALIASGRGGTPTVQGVFRTWERRATGKMSGGGGSSYYFIEDVTWTEYFYQGYALHTAYWHDGFGQPRSHGCVNLSPYDAWWVFKWSGAGGAKSPAVYTYWA